MIGIASSGLLNIVLDPIFIFVLDMGVGGAAQRSPPCLFAFAFSALIGFGQGFQPVCGFNYGAKLYRRVRQGYWFCVRTSAGFLCVLAVLGFGFAPEIISLFRKTDPDVIEIGAKALRMQASSFL